ncbi:hypothetical protein [Paenibacillus sp. FSL H7-0714]|uniref:hypothetical protein n=1 Tax=Paenibacillus sp. FSL H7-0714 TaxID=2954735 RepID=UPI0030F704A1
MNKMDAVDQAYRIATLTEPTGEIRQLLSGLSFERSLELLLMMRQSTKKVKNPAGFLRRAIQEDWQPGQIPEKIDRRIENATQRIYERNGLTPEQARQATIASRKRGF